MPPPRIPTRELREEALKLLEGRGAFLDLARELTELMRRENIPGVIIGGIAVYLHGYTRATEDIDIFIDQTSKNLNDLLIAAGFHFDEQRRKFVRYGVPVQFVTRDLVDKPPRRTVEIDGILTISLADLIGMKLESGSTNLRRTRDLSDVIELIHRHGLQSDFARHLDKSLRPTFRALIKALRQEGGG